MNNPEIALLLIYHANVLQIELCVYGFLHKAHYFLSLHDDFRTQSEGEPVIVTSHCTHAALSHPPISSDSLLSFVPAVHEIQLAD